MTATHSHHQTSSSPKRALVPRPKSILLGVTIDGSLDFYGDLPRALARDGWVVHVCAGPGRRMASLRGVPRVQVHVIPMNRTPSIFSDLLALVRWIRLMRAIRPDVTFIGTPKAGLLGNLAARILKVPRRIYVLHGLRLETSTGVARWILLHLERLTARCAHEVLCVSESLRQLAVRMSITTDGKAIVLGAGSCNGIDVGHFQEVSRRQGRARELADTIDLDPTLPTVGFVGRLTRDKGLPELAGALRLLLQEGVRVQLLVLGSIDDRSGRTALAELNDTGQKIVAVGYQDDAAFFYPLMDVFCLPSLREGLGTVILEAMASGTVVVGTNATGIISLIEPGVNGFLVPRRSAQRLAEALRSAIEHRSFAQQLATNALSMVIERYDTSVVQRRLCDYLAQFVAR